MRILKAIVSPAALAVDKAIEELHHSLAEVNAEIGILLHKRVRDISLQNEDLHEKILAISLQYKDLKSELKIVRGQLTNTEEREAKELVEQDNENLRNFSSVLGNRPGKHGNLQLCEETLQEAFPEAFEARSDYQDWSSGYDQMTWKLLQSNTAYQSWADCPNSSLLVFAGSTKEESRESQSSLCWLSPAAVHVFKHNVQQRNSIAFHSCRPDLREDSSSSRLIVSSLLHQLLAWKPDVLRHNFQEFNTIVTSDAWNSTNMRIALRCHFDLLEKVIDHLSGEKERTVILDRLDLCRGFKNQILKALQSLTRHKFRQLKIIVVMGRIPEDYDRGECYDLLESGAEYKTYGMVNWDQGITSY